MFGTMPSIRSAIVPGLFPTSGLVCHTKADAGITKDGSDFIEGWADQSGNGNDWIQTTGGIKPLHVAAALNGLPVVRFDGVDDNMKQAPFLSGTAPGEIFAILRDNLDVNQDQAHWFFSPVPQIADLLHFFFDSKFYEGFGRNVRVSQAAGFTVRSGHGIYNVSSAGSSGAQIIRWNGVEENNSASGTSAWNASNFWIGGVSSTWKFDGDYAEILIYDRVLSGAERTEVEDYLNAKWGIGAFPVTDQLLGRWDPALGVTGSAPITTWADQSGNGNDWLEDTGQGGAGPTLSSAVLNGLDVVTFDGTNDKMFQTPFLSGNAAQMMLVVRRTTTGNKGWHSIGGPATSQPHFMFGNTLYETFGVSARQDNISHAGTFDLNEWGIYSVEVDIPNFEIFMNNVSRSSSSSVASGWVGTFRLGTGNTTGFVGATNSFQGQIAEMAIWDKNLSVGERTSVFEHFNTKYALGL